MNALIVVDMQKDFCSGGSLEVKSTELIFSHINKMIKSRICDYTIFTRDWHPHNHCSFSNNGGQWPVHCVKETAGAEFSNNLQFPDTFLTVSKGTYANFEAYSGFSGTELAELLRRMCVDDVTVCGVALEYCVYETIKGAIEEGLDVSICKEAIAAIDSTSEGALHAIEYFNEFCTIISPIW